MKIVKVLAIIVALVLTIGAEAQLVNGSGGSNFPGGNGSGNGGIPGAATVPFDGGMSLLLLASGVSYGVKRMKRVASKPA